MEKSGLLGRRWVALTLSFLLPALLYSVVLCVCRIAPFGDRTLLIWDADAQYAAFLSAWRRVLLGESDALYSLSRALGGSMTGLVGYYLASPLNLLLALFPQERMPLAYTALIVLKLCLSGLTFCVFYRARFGHGAAAPFFAVGYALMGYVEAYCWDVMWLDAVLLLPLVVLGIHRLREGKPPFLYLIALAATLFCHYYIGFMVCLFSVLYFAYALLCEPGPCRARTACARFAVASLLAGGLAACMLLPVYRELEKGYSVLSASGLSFDRVNALLDVATKGYTGAIDYEQMRYGLPNWYVGIPMLLLAALALVNPAVPAKRRAGLAALLGILAVSFCVKAPYLLWHGLDEPNCLPARFSFLFSFVLILAACESARHPLPTGRIGKAAFAFVALTALLFRAGTPSYLAYETVCMDVGCALLTCAALYALARGVRRRVALGALCLLQAACLTLNGYFCIHRMGEVDAVTASGYAAEVGELLALTERVTEADDGVYRMEKNFKRSENDPLSFDYKGLSHYSSGVDANLTAFAEAVGLYSSYYRIYYASGVTPVLDDLLGVKYLLRRDDEALAPLPEGYETLWTSNGVTAYRNIDALPLAYSAPTTESELSAESPFENQNRLFADLTGLDAPVWEPVETEIQAADQWMDVRFAVKAGESYYIKTAGWYFFLNDGDMTNTGFFGCVALPKAERDAEYRLYTYVGESEPLAYVARLDEDALARGMAALGACGAAVASDTDSHLVVETVATDERPVLLLTIPFDEGWQVTVDGQPGAPTRRYGALTAVTLAPGAHTVELRYRPEGLRAGLIVSAASALLTLAWAWLFRRRFAIPSPAARKP